MASSPVLPPSSDAPIVAEEIITKRTYAPELAAEHVLSKLESTSSASKSAAGGGKAVKAEASALATQCLIALLAVMLSSTILRNHYILAAASGFAYYFATNYPAWTAVAGIGASVPVLLLFIMRHSWLSIVTLVVALAAYRCVSFSESHAAYSPDSEAVLTRPAGNASHHSCSMADEGAKQQLRAAIGDLTGLTMEQPSSTYSSPVLSKGDQQVARQAQQAAVSM